MSKNVPVYRKLDGSKLTIGIAVSRWNGEITESLLIGALQALHESGVKEKNITVVDVAGSYELPYAAKIFMQSKKKFDAIITLGCLIKGETKHDEYIANSVAQGLMELNINGTVPVVFGILTCNNEKQAKARSRGDNNHGYGWSMAAVEMALLKKRV